MLNMIFLLNFCLVTLPSLTSSQLFRPQRPHNRIPTVTIHAHDPFVSSGSSLTQQTLSSIGSNQVVNQGNGVCCPCNSCCSCRKESEKDSQKVPSFTQEMIDNLSQTRFRPTDNNNMDGIGLTTGYSRPTFPVFGMNRLGLKNRNHYPIPPVYAKDPLDLYRMGENLTDFL
jgi:hypothetical protein